MNKVKNQDHTQNHPWTEDVSKAYKNFLQYAGPEVHAGINHNRQVLTLFGSQVNCKKEEPQLHAHNGAFYPLATALSSPLYCSKLTVRNVEKANLLFYFKDSIMGGILGMEVDDRQAARQLQIAYRNIVPPEFAQATQLAGPMGYHEYLIDGNDFAKEAQISFFANSNFAATPIKIVLENCKGQSTIIGLSASSAKNIFENKSDSKEFNCIIMPDMNFESENEQFEKIVSSAPRLG